MRLSGRVKGTGHRSGGRNDPRLLTREQEGELAERILYLADHGFPLTMDKVRETAFEYARANGIKEFSPHSKDKKGGRKWFKFFMQRFPELAMKTARQISRNRAKAVTKEAIDNWFLEYNSVLNEKKISDPRYIWNVDETGVTNMPKPSTFIGRKGSDLKQIVADERPQISTIIAAVNAAGERMDPLIIHRGRRVPETWIRRAPKNVIVKASIKGYVTDAVFHEWGKHFIEHLRRTGELGKPHVLILDGHGSHVYNMPFINNMIHHKVVVLTLTPHTTHATQPIDQCPLAVFKRFFNWKLEVWCRERRGKALNKLDFWKVFLPAWERSMTERNIRGGFKMTGVYPLNPNAIPYHKFIPNSDSESSDSDDDNDDDDYLDDDDCKLIICGSICGLQIVFF